MYFAKRAVIAIGSALVSVGLDLGQPRGAIFTAGLTLILMALMEAVDPMSK
jgi:hypothetical protein